jgi:hypothetical protein
MAPRLRSQTGILKSVDLVYVDGKPYWLVDKHKRNGKWYKRLLPALAGGGMGFVDSPMVLVQDGPALNTFTTAKSVFGTTTDAAGQVRYIAAPNFWFIGKTLKITAVGDLSNIVTTPGTITFQFQVGPTQNIAAWTSGAINFTTTAHVSLPFWLDIMLTCQAVGPGTLTKLMGQGRITGNGLAITAAQADPATLIENPTLMVPNTTPAQGTGFDGTIAQQLDLFAGFSISQPTNGIRVRQFVLEAMN